MAKPSDDSQAAVTRRVAYRLAIPGLALCLFGAVAALWVSDLRPIYFGLLNFLGVNPYQIPFLDLHAVLSEAECHRLGFDVYVTNPCDVLQRLDGYPPLWLAITPWGTHATALAGVIVDLLFIFALPLVIRPRSVGDVLVFAAATFSPMTMFALERANVDIIVFLLLLCGAALFLAPRPYRLGAYAVFVIGGLLKIYPLVLLVLMVRERWRNVVVPAAVVATSLILYGLYDGADFYRSLANIPPVPYFTNGFFAGDLPYGIAENVGDHPVLASALALSLLSILLVLAGLLTWRNVRLVAAIEIDWAEWDMSLLAVGCLVLVGCFLLAPNVDYRGIYFLFVLPGLLRLRQSATDAELRTFFSSLIAVTIFVMWKEFFRHSILALDDALPIAVVRHIDVAFWAGRELIWWWLVAGLGAIVVRCIWAMPLTKDGVAGLRQLARLSLNPF